MSKADSTSKLKRELSFWDILFFGMGSILGAGIYAIIGEAAGLSGNLIWLSFVVAAVVSTLSALSYAEFCSRFPDAGGSFEYIKQGLGQTAGYIMGVFSLFTGIVAGAAIAISFSDYLSRLLEVPTYVTTIGIIILIMVINMVGIRQSSVFNMVATLITLAGLLLVIITSIPDWGSVDYISDNGQGLFSILGASALIFFSYVGFEDLVKMAEETHNAETNIPKGIIYSAGIVLIMYVLIAISAVSVVSWDELAYSNGPLADVIEKKLGSTGALILIIVALFATSKTILSNMLGASRLLFDIARDSGHKMMERLTATNARTGTPLFAVGAIGIVTVFFGLIGNLKIVASISNIFIFCVFLMVNISLIRYRYLNKQHAHAPFRIPLNIRNIPILTLLGIIGILILLGFNIVNILSS